MLYEICATSIWISTGEEFDRLLEAFPCLKYFGFTKIPREVPTGAWIWDESHRQIWQPGPPKIVYDPYIELNSLEDLDRFMKAVDESLVIRPGAIEIYDTWRE